MRTSAPPQLSLHKGLVHVRRVVLKALERLNAELSSVGAMQKIALRAALERSVTLMVDAKESDDAVLLKKALAMVDRPDDARLV